MTTAFDLMVAPNGARHTKRHHPALPVTNEEISQTAARCAEAGATAIHVHVRDRRGHHSLDPERYKSVIGSIRAATPIHTQISTESAGKFDLDDQINCLRAAPATEASIALREALAHPARVREPYDVALGRGMSVQHILYDTSEVAQLLDLYDQGEIPADDRHVIFVLGRYAPARHAEPSDAVAFASAARGSKLRWSACAFGPREQECLLTALDLGGDVRVGFENNILAPDGTVFPNNETAVGALVEAADKAGFSPRKVA